MATGNMKDIKRRIKSVGSTMQITKAMELVASSKLRHGRKKTKNAHPFFEAQVRMLVEISDNHNIETVFTKHTVKPGEEPRVLYIVIAGDRGLAGGYNSQIFKMVAASHEGKAKPKIMAIGKKAVEYFEKRDYEIISAHSGLAENVKSGHCAEIANTAIKHFLDNDIDEIKLFYTKFVSSITQEPAVLPLLPLPIEGLGDLRSAVLDKEDENGNKISAPKIETPPKKAGREINYDPNPEAVFNRVIPSFLMSIIHCAIIESYTSEQSARRVAMENASDNAEEMIGNLSLLYNRARQEKITNELNEIVGGANAL